MRLERSRATLAAVLKAVRAIEAEPDTNSLLRIQQQLARFLLRAERLIARNKSRAAEVRRELRAGRPPKDAAAALRRAETSLHARIDNSQAVLFAARCVGDAIAFTIFDRWDLKPLSFKQSAGSLSGKSGSALESRILAGLLRAGHPAVRCDLTNALRFGDIAVLAEGRLQVLEVKSGSSSNARVRRQLDGITRMLDYFATDQIDGLYGMPRILRRAFHAPLVDHIDRLNELIESRAPFAMEEVERGLRYGVVRSAAGAHALRFVEGIRRPLVFLPNDEKTARRWTGYYPFTLSIRRPEHVLEFLEDAFVVLVAVDLDALGDIAHERGYDTHLLEGDPMIRFAARDASPETVLCASQHFIGRLGHDFLSLRWLIEEALQPIDPAFVEAFSDTTGWIVPQTPPSPPLRTR